MLRALYAGVSGLKAHQIKMDVIGNNIANVNTAGFRASSVVFSDVLSQTISRASSANAATGKGGMNAKQIGLGTGVASISFDPSATGSAQTTGNTWDMMIDGSSFFVVNRGGVNYFTKVGSFAEDPNTGNLVSPSGDRVMGWKVDPNDPTKILKGDVSPITISSPENNFSPPKATTSATLSGNIDRKDSIFTKDSNGVDIVPPAMGVGKEFSYQIYDEQGYAYTVTMSMQQVSDPGVSPDKNNYVLGIKDITDVNGTSLIHPTTTTPAVPPAFTATLDNTAVVFDANTGKLTGMGTGTNQFFKIRFAPTTGATNPFGDVTKDVTVNCAGLTMFANGSTTKISAKKGVVDTTTGVVTGAGRKVGTLIDSIVSSDGTIHGVYDNEDTRLLGQIAVAAFENPSGLEKIGDNLFQQSINSGTFDGIGMDATETGGSINSGRLELSTVDLSLEFTEMIVTQRGFQANSRIITTADSLMEELVNLKR